MSAPYAPDCLLVLQSGGSTATANAILAGAVAAAQRRGVPVEGVLGGLGGLVEGRLAPLGELDADALARLAARPGCALVSFRGALDAGAEQAVAATLRARRAALLTIGGDGSLRATAHLGQLAGAPVAGVLNTIDNDVQGFAYAPGFLSAAALLADAVAAARLDMHAMQSCNDVALIETMGRDCGWLAAAAAALGHADLVFVPERPRPLAEMTVAVAAHVAQAGTATVVVAEGAREPSGRLLAERAGPIPPDPLGRPVIDMSAGPASALAEWLRAEHGLRSRVVRPGIVQRGSGPLAQEREEARALGGAAAAALLDGRCGEAFGPGATRPLDRLRPRRLRRPQLDADGVVPHAVRAALADWLVPREPSPDQDFVIV